MALEFALKCLLHDLYEGGDSAVDMYLTAVVETLDLYTAELAGSTSGKSVDLLDQASFCLLTTLESSQYARQKIVSAGSDAFGM